MTPAIALLNLALSLLIAAQGPNVPTELKTEAIHTATYAIEYAQASMTESPPEKEVEVSVPRETQVESEPSAGEVAGYGESYDNKQKSKYIYGKPDWSKDPLMK